MFNNRNDMTKFLREHAEQQQSASQRLNPIIKRWERTRLLEGVKGSDKVTLAQMLQNQANQMLLEASRTSTSAGHEEWNGIALPMVRKIFVEQMAKKLVHVHAMDKPSGLVFYLDFEVDKNKPSQNPIYNQGDSVYGTTDGAEVEGGFYGGDKYSYSMNYYSASATASATGSANWATDLEYEQSLSASAAAGNVLSVTVPYDTAWKADEEALTTFTISNAGGDFVSVLRRFTKLDKVGGTLTFFYAGTAPEVGEAVTVVYTEQPNSFDRGDYEIGQSGVGTIDEINIKVTQRQIVAKTRKLRTEITPELIQDLNAYQALDAQKELTTMMSQYIEHEQDTELLNMLSRAGRGITRYWSALTGRFVDAKTGVIQTSQPTFTQTPNEWFRTLGIRIEDVSNEVHKRTLRGGANWAVVSPKVATLLTSFNTFQTSENAGTFSMGVEEVGSLNGRIKLYKNPYWRDNEILMGFKGANFLETGAAFGTYIPLILTPPLTDPSDFTIKQGIMTRNSKIVLRDEYYARILIRDLDVI
jgi:hypothetical protein